MKGLKPTVALFLVVIAYSGVLSPACAMSNPLRQKQHHEAKRIEQNQGLSFLMTETQLSECVSTPEPHASSQDASTKESPECSLSEPVLKAK